MLSYFLGLAALSADPAGAAAIGRIEVGGYVPATCRAREGDAAPFCNGAASVAVSEEETAGDTRLIRIVVSPR
jgi:hypothetical protein